MLEVYPIWSRSWWMIGRRLLAKRGGRMHADYARALLLAEGGEQDDLWGANWGALRGLHRVRVVDQHPSRLQAVAALSSRTKMSGSRVAAIINALLGGVQ
ncbi:hypothetical protein [Candidatus Amarolinea dominans]|uniref:hypothetical protein n=1 Tax=Candidatus Amarolinea dominans TaxID=3140696 RepID=UPI003135E46C|nr:hypothetical protein [Anaerolineae bacterium]